MVRAILEGRKIQTRRIVKPQPTIHGNEVRWKGELSWKDWKCPYGQVGDRLWVRESFYLLRFAGREKTLNDVLYLDDSLVDDKEYMYNYSKKPSIHMPRWASRITLEITDIRVERLQEISKEDCHKEGFLQPKCKCGYNCTENEEFELFEECWNSIHGKDAWDRNDWVWVITFKKNNTSAKGKLSKTTKQGGD
jgi:hypothetical protein